MKTFGEFARDQIKFLGKSQKALARSLGVSPAYISQIFTGKKNPPDLGRARNRRQLEVWCEFLNAAEEDLLDMIRFQLHRVPPRPSARYRNMRRFLLDSLSKESRSLAEEIRGLELHPAEGAIIHTLVQIYMIREEEVPESSAYGTVRFRELCLHAKSDKRFVERELVEFFSSLPFTWNWDPDSNRMSLSTDSPDLQDAVEKLNELEGSDSRVEYGKKVPVVGHVSAGEGFAFTDGGYMAGDGFELVDLPPGVSPDLAHKVYCVRVRGESLREFINEGALLFIKPESWEEIRDGDLVIFKDRDLSRAFVKKVEFAGDSLVLRSLNPLYKNLVRRREELALLERVLCVVF